VGGRGWRVGLVEGIIVAVLIACLFLVVSLGGCAKVIVNTGAGAIDTGIAVEPSVIRVEPKKGAH
jgi:MFS superfamily sulfate permease-like transporter